MRQRLEMWIRDTRGQGHTGKAVIVVLLLVGLAVLQSGLMQQPFIGTAAAWHSSYGDWDYYKVCGIDANVVNDYQMFINVTKSSGGDVDCEGHCNDDFSDIRFGDIDNSTTLDYWIEYKSDGNWANIWVECPSDVESDSKILMFYGNSGASSASDGDATFIFFDDFDNLDAWTDNSDGYITATGGVCEVTNDANDNTWHYISKDLGSAQKIRMLSRQRYTSIGSYAAHSLHIGDDTLSSWDANPPNSLALYFYTGSTHRYRMTDNGDSASDADFNPSADTWYRGYGKYYDAEYIYSDDYPTDTP